ncbi:transposase [Elysia marginata]|uniref:Transposase n=1 Tax=Elysia marginata TaxID=1093978 RepID=A0AAV4I0G8_9GAST|nr:transposase [Elysia marginata]
MLFSGVNILAWCVMAVSILSSSVKVPPTVKLLEHKATTSCGNFQVAGQDYTQLKYYITGANASYKIGSFLAPELIDLPDENYICSLINSYTGNCTRTQECWCEEISPGEFHFTYNKTADADTSNYTVVMQWSARTGKVRSAQYTFHKVFTGIESLSDCPRPGRPKSCVNEQTIASIKKDIDEHPHISVRELSDTNGLSYGSVHTIKTENLRMKKDRLAGWEFDRIQDLAKAVNSEVCSGCGRSG